MTPKVGGVVGRTVDCNVCWVGIHVEPKAREFSVGTIERLFKRQFMY